MVDSILTEVSHSLMHLYLFEVQLSLEKTQNRTLSLNIVQRCIGWGRGGAAPSLVENFSGKVLVIWATVLGIKHCRLKGFKACRPSLYYALCTPIFNIIFWHNCLGKYLLTYPETSLCFMEKNHGTP